MTVVTTSAERDEMKRTLNVYILLRLDTSPNPLNGGGGFDGQTGDVLNCKRRIIMATITTRDMRSLLEAGGKLRLGAVAVGKLVRGELREEQPDLQWLYDCAMERGNSEGTFVDDPVRLRFTNAGTCTLGIVCDILFCNTSLPARVLAKRWEGSPVWPEDMDGIEPAFVDFTYDVALDGEEGNE